MNCECVCILQHFTIIYFLRPSFCLCFFFLFLTSIFCSTTVLHQRTRVHTPTHTHQYILQLPETITATSNVAEHGPLAMVLAPTRELALQIEIEFQKLLTYCGTPPNKILATPIVGGQNMTAQAQRIRAGVHIVVGTPGRINECLELTYMVLNQCSYCVLDEGDRMIDMGFAPQLESILDHMGGSLKSENEHEAYEQEKEDLNKLKKEL